MKNKLKPMLAAILGLCLIFALTACGKDPDTGKTTTNSDWSAVGIDGGFNAQVKGTQVANKAADGAIEMKWIGSDEESLDNTIAWLRGQSFTSYGTSASGKEYAEGGAVITYTAAKTVSASSDGGGGGGLFAAAPMAYAAAAESEKTVVAEAIFVTQDITFGGMSVKAGELYVDIEEETEVAIPSATTTTWQAQPIADVLGAAIPAYTGTATSFYTQTNKLGVGFAQVVVNGSEQTGVAAYQGALVEAGYAADGEEYVKTLGNGNKIRVICMWAPSYNMDDIMSGNFTGEAEYAVMITARLEKIAGDLTAWPANRLSSFPGLPAYTGTGATYDFEDAWAEMGVTMPAMPDIGSTIPGMDLDTIINMLPADEREEARAALKIYEEVRKSFQYIRVNLVTVYGTTSEGVTAYKTALKTAGFTYTQTGYTKQFKSGVDLVAMVEIEYYDGIARIALTRMPKVFLDYSEEDYETNVTEPTLPDDEPFGFADLPQNVKFAYRSTVGNSAMEYTVTKIGNNYLIADNSQDILYYLKYADGLWTPYVKYADSDWTANGSAVTDLSRNAICAAFMFLFSGHSGYTKGGTEIIAGQTCDVYTKIDHENYMGQVEKITTETRKINAAEFTLEAQTVQQITTNGETQTVTTKKEVTLWETTVTDFGGITLPT